MREISWAGKARARQMSMPSARVHIKMTKESTRYPSRRTRRNSPHRPRLRVRRVRFRGECRRDSRTLRLRGWCRDAAVSNRHDAVPAPHGAVEGTASSGGSSRKCADVVGFCAFYDKCERPSHEKIGKNHRDCDRRRLLKIGQYTNRIAGTQEQIARRIDELAAGQEQMTHEISRLRTVTQYLLYKSSEPPPRPVPTPAPKPVPRPPQAPTVH
jgi:hypothetical protein